MLRVKDENGNIVAGLFKDNLGNLVVNDNKAYNTYLKSKQQQETINNLSKELTELKELINNLLANSVINSNKEPTEINNG